MHTQKDQLGSEGGERQSGHQTVIRFYWIKAGAKVSRQSVTDQTIRKEMEGGENGCHEHVEVKKKEIDTGLATYYCTLVFPSGQM